MALDQSVGLFGIHSVGITQDRKGLLTWEESGRDPLTAQAVSGVEAA